MGRDYRGLSRVFLYVVKFLKRTSQNSESFFLKKKTEVESYRSSVYVVESKEVILFSKY